MEETNYICVFKWSVLNIHAVSGFGGATNSRSLMTHLRKQRGPAGLLGTCRRHLGDIFCIYK